MFEPYLIDIIHSSSGNSEFSTSDNTKSISILMDSSEEFRSTTDDNSCDLWNILVSKSDYDELLDDVDAIHSILHNTKYNELKVYMFQIDIIDRKLNGFTGHAEFAKACDFITTLVYPNNTIKLIRELNRIKFHLIRFAEVNDFEWNVEAIDKSDYQKLHNKITKNLCLLNHVCKYIYNFNELRRYLTFELKHIEDLLLLIRKSDCGLEKLQRIYQKLVKFKHDIYMRSTITRERAKDNQKK